MDHKEHSLELTVPALTSPMRIDAWVSQHTPSFLRSVASDSRTLFYINGHRVKKSKLVRAGDQLLVTWVEDVMSQISAQAIPLDVLYEDDQLLVINKQQGLIVHPGVGNWEGTLVNGLIHRYGPTFFAADSGSEGDEDAETTLRPGIVHRLDKDTSGVMVIAKDQVSHLNLSSQFKARTTEKYYIALVRGSLPALKGSIETTLMRDRRNRKRFCVGPEGEGKVSRTDYYQLRQYDGFALVRLHLITGRTHQIRVHMQHLGCPVVGDPLYGKRGKATRDATLMLHAFSLAFTHPNTQQWRLFRAPLPSRFKEYIAKIR